MKKAEAFYIAWKDALDMIKDGNEIADKQKKNDLNVLRKHIDDANAEMDSAVAYVDAKWKTLTARQEEEDTEIRQTNWTGLFQPFQLEPDIIKFAERFEQIFNQ